MTEQTKNSSAIGKFENSRELLRAQNVGIVRSGRWLVRNVDLKVREGEIVTLIGPNGSGKSTTAKIILGLLPPDEGRIHLAKRSKPLRIGYVPQSLAIDPDFAPECQAPYDPERVLSSCRN